jgi:hypothetical protein
MLDVHGLIEQVIDAPTFLKFAQALTLDRVESKKMELFAQVNANVAEENKWENTTIESFLEAAITWAEDSDFGISQGLLPSNPWRQFAVFLYCGKIYE